MSEIPVLYGQYDDEGNPLWMDGAVRQMFALRAENARLREALLNVKAAWESLPGHSNYSVSVVQFWLITEMKPAIDEVRAALTGETAETKK